MTMTIRYEYQRRYKNAVSAERAVSEICHAARRIVFAFGDVIVVYRLAWPPALDQPPAPAHWDTD